MTSARRFLRRRLAVGVSVALLLWAACATSFTYVYDRVPLPEHTVSLGAVPAAVTHAFVAALDPDFYDSGDSLVTRRYVTAVAGEQSRWRTWVLVNKAEDAYSRDDILHRYLDRADYGRGAVGLAAAARASFGKPAEELTVAEAAVLAVRLHPDRPAPEAGWARVLDTMVERGWLTATARAGLSFPG